MVWITTAVKSARVLSLSPASNVPTSGYTFTSVRFSSRPPASSSRTSSFTASGSTVALMGFGGSSASIQWLVILTLILSFIPDSTLTISVHSSSLSSRQTPTISGYRDAAATHPLCLKRLANAEVSNVGVASEIPETGPSIAESVAGFTGQYSTGVVRHWPHGFNVHWHMVVVAVKVVEIVVVRVVVPTTSEDAPWPAPSASPVQVIACKSGKGLSSLMLV